MASIAAEPQSEGRHIAVTEGRHIAVTANVPGPVTWSSYKFTGKMHKYD